MTKVFFIRHALPDFSVHDDLTRPLTEEGIKGSLKVTEFLKDKGVTKIISSPYKRAVDTILDFSLKYNLPIEVMDDFRERKIDDVWIENFNAFTKAQWEDFDYKLANGESLNEVQQRNVKALEYVLSKYPNESIVIGTHGTALSTIINFYNKRFNFQEFERIKFLMPHVVYFEFDGLNLIKIEEYSL